MNTFRVALLHENAKTPTKGSAQAVGWDLYAIEDTILDWRRVTAVRTGIAIEFPPDMIASIRPRSGLSKDGLVVTLGTIDPDYRGELIVLIHNVNPDRRFIKQGDRVAQLTFEATWRLDRVDTVAYGALSTTERNTGGFGSSGA